MNDDKSRAAFEVWLRTVCFQKPTPEAYDLAVSAWQECRKQMHKEMGERFSGGTARALTDEQEEDVIQMRAQDISFKVIQRKYPVSRQTLDRIANRRNRS